MLDLDQAIRERRSTRMFLPQPVPRELVNEALALAQCAPSNSNIQPWHMVFASGAPRDRLVAALLDEARRRPPNIPPLPESFQHYHRELGAQVFGSMGIAREDKAGRAAAVLRNWEFFRAPLAGIVCMHRDLGPADAVSVGMYLQTLLLALTEPAWGRASRSRSRTPHHGYVGSYPQCLCAINCDKLSDPNLYTGQEKRTPGYLRSPSTLRSGYPLELHRLCGEVDSEPILPQ